MTGNMKLLFVVNDPAFFLSHRLPLACAARSAGFDVHVATPEEEAVRKIRAEGFVHHPLSLSKHGTDLRTELRTLKELYRLFRKLRPDLVHLVTIKPVLYGGIAARMARVPAVVSAISGLGHLFIERGIKVSILRFLARQAYRVSLKHPNQRVIFQNPDDLARFVDGALVDKARAVLIKGAGVDMEVFFPSFEPTGRPIVLFAGRMLWEKGVGEFARAARQLKRRGVDARFVLVGECPSWNRSAVPKEQLMAWVDENILEWWGRKEDMVAVINSATVVCLPSYREGVPKTLVEAAACGRPIVTTDTSGCREVVREGVNGLLVPIREVEALALALERLLTDRPLGREMGKRGRAIAEEEFSLAGVVGETMGLYTDLLAAANE